jgi:hypothetical protein
LMLTRVLRITISFSAKNNLKISLCQCSNFDKGFFFYQKVII